MGLLTLDLERPFASVECRGWGGLFVKLEAPSGWVFQARRGRKLPSSSFPTRKKWHEMLRHFFKFKLQPHLPPSKFPKS